MSRKFSGSNFVLVSLNQEGFGFPRGKRAIPGFAMKGDTLHRTASGKKIPVKVQKEFTKVRFVRAFIRLKLGNQIFVNGVAYLVARPK